MQKEKNSTQIFFTSFLDIVLILVLFLFINHYQQESYILHSIEVPSVQTEQQGESVKDQEHILVMNQQGDILWLGKTYTKEEFTQRLLQMKESYPPETTLFYLVGDKDASYASLVSFLQALSDLSYQRVYLLSEKEKS